MDLCLRRRGYGGCYSSSINTIPGGPREANWPSPPVKTQTKSIERTLSNNIFDGNIDGGIPSARGVRSLYKFGIGERPWAFQPPDLMGIY